MPRRRVAPALGLLPLVASLAACGGGSGETAPRDGAPSMTGDGSTPAPDGARAEGGPAGTDGAVPPAVARCSAGPSFLLASADADAYPIDVVVERETIALLYVVESPRRMLLGVSTLAEPTIVAPVELGETPVLQEASVVALDGGFVAAWTDFPDPPAPHVRVQRVLDGSVVSDVRLGGEITVGGATAALTPAGRLAVTWGEQTSGVRFAQRAAVGDDAVTFGAPVTIREGAARPSSASLAASRSALGMAWVERTDGPNHTTLWFTTLDEDARPAPPVRVVEHDRYVYETALAFGHDRFALGTTDSRADILVVPLYLTLLDAEGAVVREGIRLTTDHHHEEVDVAFGGNAFVLVSIPFIDMGATNAQQVFSRQLDEEGEILGEPLQVSSASIRESDCCVRANHARVAPIDPARYLVVWAEHGQRPDRPVFVARGAIVDCKP